MRKADVEELTSAEGIGEVLAKAWRDYFDQEKNNLQLDHLLQVLDIQKKSVPEGEGIFQGKTFVITGSLTHFSNRKELQNLIESLGGKAAGSVSSKTSYLINNDTASNSSKNKKAKELGIPILSEEDFLTMVKENEGENL